MTPILLTWAALSGWPTGENLARLKAHAAELLIERAFRDQGFVGPAPTWENVETLRLGSLRMSLNVRDRLRETIELLDWVPDLVTDDPKRLDYYRMQQQKYRQRLEEIERTIIRQSEPTPKFTLPPGWVHPAQRSRNDGTNGTVAPPPHAVKK